MKKLCTIAFVSLAAVGLLAEQAQAWIGLKCLCCGCSKYKVNCYPPNAFSPPCCYPCFGMAPFAYPGCNHHGCGQGCGDGGYAGGYNCGPNGCGPTMGAPAAPGTATMPPANAAPQYMPPAPAEADGGQARMMPTMPMYGQMMPAQNVMYQPMAMGGYYGAGMPQMYPGMQMQQPMMMPPQMMAPQMMQQPMAPQMLAPQVMQQGYQAR